VTKLTRGRDINGAHCYTDAYHTNSKHMVSYMSFTQLIIWVPFPQPNVAGVLAYEAFALYEPSGFRKLSFQISAEIV
jgi:hypothetical protein